MLCTVPYSGPIGDPTDSYENVVPGHGGGVVANPFARHHARSSRETVVGPRLVRMNSAPVDAPASVATSKPDPRCTGETRRDNRARLLHNALQVSGTSQA